VAGSLNWSNFSTSTVSVFVILSETFFNHGQAFRLVNYVCHRTDRPTAGDSIVHHLVPIPGLTYLESTTIQVTLAGKPAKILAAKLSPSHPLIRAELSACFGEEMTVLMAGDLAKLAAEHKTGGNPV
jgi:hypothetical protein